MNATAKELGMSQTHYTDPSGFEETTVSTASRPGEAGARWRWRTRPSPRSSPSPRRCCRWSAASPTINELVGHDGYVGIKTGSDSAAGGCLLFAKRMTVGGHTFTVLGAIFGQHDGELVSAALAGADRLAELGRRRGEEPGRDPRRDDQ